MACAEVHRREEPRCAGGNREMSAWLQHGLCQEVSMRLEGRAGARPQELQRLYWEGCGAGRT